VINLHRCPRYKSSNTKLHDTNLNKLALPTPNTGRTRATQQQTFKFQLKSKFTQLKLLNCSTAPLECMHTVNTMKMRPKTINRPITSIADSQLSLELFEEGGNTTIRSTINSTDRQLIAKSYKTSVECQYSTDEWNTDARAVASSTAGSSGSDLIIIQTDRLSLHAKRVKINANTYVNYSSKRMNARISLQTLTVFSEPLSALIAQTHIHTLKLHGN